MIKSLGYVTVPTPGTPVRASINARVPADRIGAQTVQFQALPGNTGLVYVGTSPTFNKTTGVGVVAIIPAPASAVNGAFGGYGPNLPTVPGGLNVAELWIDAVVAGNGVVVSYTQG